MADAPNDTARAIVDRFWEDLLRVEPVLATEVGDERYVARLRALPAYLDAFEPIMREGIASGMIAPGVIVDRTIAQMQRLITAGVEGSPAHQPIPQDEAAAREQVDRALEEAVLPTYQRYLDALTDYRPHATETIGLVDLPGGDAGYRSSDLAWTALEMDPEEIHRIGLEELEGIQEERRTIA